MLHKGRTSESVDRDSIPNDVLREHCDLAQVWHEHLAAISLYDNNIYQDIKLTGVKTAQQESCS